LTAAWVEQQHATAILDRLAAALPVTPALIVYDGQTPKPEDLAPEYVLVYMYTTRPNGTSLNSASDRAVTRAVCHCVGGDAMAARAVAGRVASALLDVRPTIAGRVCFPIRDDGSAQPPRPDKSIPGLIFMDQIVTYRLESVPAST
jgi:hypothetical protein